MNRFPTRSNRFTQASRNQCLLTPRRGGFTLIELMVVLSIAAVVTSITIGGYREMTEGNKRTACQTNLTQIYQGLRLYAADQDGLYPPLTIDSTTGNPTSGIGLWALYTYPADGSPNGVDIAGVGAKPVLGYVRSTKVFHCPSDSDFENEASRENLYIDDTKLQFNPNHLSYQMIDNNGTPQTPGDDVPTYLPVRTLDRSNPYWKRQMDQRVDIAGVPTRVASAQPQDDTVVTWCRHHRSVRDRDTVLFLDGSVQLIAREQDDAREADCTPVTGIRTDFKRLPKRTNCQG